MDPLLDCTLKTASLGWMILAALFCRLYFMSSFVHSSLMILQSLYMSGNYGISFRQDSFSYLFLAEKVSSSHLRVFSIEAMKGQASEELNEGEIIPPSLRLEFSKKLLLHVNVLSA